MEAKLGRKIKPTEQARPQEESKGSGGVLV